MRLQQAAAPPGALSMQPCYFAPLQHAPKTKSNITPDNYSLHNSRPDQKSCRGKIACFVATTTVDRGCMSLFPVPHPQRHPGAPRTHQAPMKSPAVFRSLANLAHSRHCVTCWPLARSCAPPISCIVAIPRSPSDATRLCASRCRRCRRCCWRRYALRVDLNGHAGRDAHLHRVLRRHVDGQMRAGAPVTSTVGVPV